MALSNKLTILSQNVNVGEVSRQGRFVTYWGFIDRVTHAETAHMEGGGQDSEAVLREKAYKCGEEKVREYAQRLIEALAPDEVALGSPIERHQAFDLESDDILILWRIPITHKHPSIVKNVGIED